MNVYLKGLNSCAQRKQKLLAYRRYLQANGHCLVDTPEQADAILLWSCGFRGDMRDVSLDVIRELDAEYDAKLIVAGCLPDIDPKALGENFGGTVIPWKREGELLGAVFGSEVSIEEIEQTCVEENLCSDLEKFKLENPNTAVTFHDQFIKMVVSEGCSYECTYCSERHAFPAYRSFDEDRLIAECRETIDRTGRRDLILLADSLGEYGKDTGSSLIELIERICAIGEGVRVALNNFNPACFMRMFDPLVKLAGEGKIAHLNLPIQSASDRILKLMKRQYCVDELDRMFATLNGIGFRDFDTHVIVGFPGETEGDFAQTVDFVLRHKPRYVLASHFMSSDIIEASKLPGRVSPEVQTERSGQLYEKMKENGIICNTDGSELAGERLRRVRMG